MADLADIQIKTPDSQGPEIAVQQRKKSCCPCRLKTLLRKGRESTQIEPWSCWITLFSAFWVNTLVAALETAFPLFYDPLRDKYGASRANVGTSASLMISFGSISALLCAPLMNMYGCRPVAFVGCIMEFIGLLLCAFAPSIEVFHLFYGVIAGVGYGLLYIPSLTIVQQTFTYNRGLATGLALLGFTAGTILAPILFEYLLRKYGLFGSLLLQTGLHAQNFIFVWAFNSPDKYKDIGGKTAKKEISKEDEKDLQADVQLCDKDNENSVHGAQTENQKCILEGKSDEPSQSKLKSFCTSLMDFSICRDIKFDLYVIVRLGWFFGRFCINTHIVSAATFLGVELTKASYLPSIMGLSNLAMRSFSTLILNLKRLDKEIYFTIGIVCVTAAAVFSATADGYYFLLAAMILVGFNEGISTTSQPLVVANLVGIEDFGKAMAVVEIATVPASLAAGPFSGWLVDMSNSYLVTFLFAACSGFVSLVLIIIIVILLRRSQKQKPKTVKPEGEIPTLVNEELQPLAGVNGNIA